MSQKLLYVAATNFEAARSVDCLPAGHRSRHLHGHSFMTEVRTALPDGWAQFTGAEVAELTERLQQCVAPLNYNHLNAILNSPTDENLARWIRQRLCLPGIEHVHLQSTRQEGVDLDPDDFAHVWRRYIFQSAHRLPNVPDGHKCGRMHGHGFEVVLHAKKNPGDCNRSIDYNLLDETWAPLHSQLNFACLNDITGLENPTSENIAGWIWNKLKPNLAELTQITVNETETCGASFDGDSFRIWKEFKLDSAVRLKCAPQDDARRHIHGHSFTLRLHLHAPLDRVLGWIVDFGDVKEIFNPIFRQIDHHPLHEFMGDEDSDTASIARRIQEMAAPLIPSLHRIDLNETRGCGVILHWGE